MAVETILTTEKTAMQNGTKQIKEIASIVFKNAYPDLKIIAVDVIHDIDCFEEPILDVVLTFDGDLSDVDPMIASELYSRMRGRLENVGEMNFPFVGYHLHSSKDAHP